MSKSKMQKLRKRKNKADKENIKNEADIAKLAHLTKLSKEGTMKTSEKVNPNDIFLIFNKTSRMELNFQNREDR